jgi:hypothetical protein
MDQMMNDKDPERMARTTHVFLQLKKFELAALEEYEGGWQKPLTQ